MHVELVEASTFYNDLEAHIAKGLLEDNGIDAYLRRDDCGGMEPQLQITEGIKLMVDSTQLNSAKEILSKYQVEQLEKPFEDNEEWECSNCGEILEVQFTDCWNCGYQRSVD